MCYRPFQITYVTLLNHTKTIHNSNHTHSLTTFDQVAQTKVVTPIYVVVLA